MTSFAVTVLGANGTYPTPDGASTGYLISSEGTNIWLDAGTGTFANLQRYIGVFDLRAIILSHLHLDHILDIYPLYYALRYSPETKGPEGLEVFAPAGSEEHLGKLLNDNGDCDFGGYLEFKTVGHGDSIEVGPFSITFARTCHPIETLGVRFDAYGKSLAISSDSAPCSEVEDLAKGADVFIAEASLQAPNEELAEIHMTAEEAGRMAAKAGVGRLVLTHVLPGLDKSISIRQAEERFGGKVDAASDHLTIKL